MSRPAPEPRVDALDVLYCLDAAFVGRRFLLIPPVTTVGRQSGSDVVIGCESMSRRHARFEWRDDGWWVVDLSTNGIWVDGAVVVVERSVRRGDHIQLGRTILRVDDPDRESEIVEVVYTGSPFDGLTGLYARHHLMDCMEREIRREGAVSLVRLDVRGFKKINDTYGHDAGDAVLREVARVAKEHVPEGGLLARYRADELALWLPGSTREDAAAAGERMRAALEAHVYVVGETSLPGLKVQMGVAQVNDATWRTGDPRGALVADADPKRR